MASPFAHLVDLNGTLGAMEIGITFNVFMTGVITVQAYQYYSRFTKDGKALRFFVLLIWLCELGHSSTLLHTLYVFTVTSFGNPLTLIQPPSTLVLTMVFGGLSTAFVQGFLAWRVYQVAKVLPLSIVSWILSLLRLVGCIAITVTGWHMENLPRYKIKHQWIFISLLVISLTNDILITGGLCTSLVNSKQRAQKRTSAVIDRLILWTLETGLLTAIFSCVILICFFTMPLNYVWIGIYAVSSKLYSNSLLAILNGRASLRENLESVPSASLSMRSTNSHVVRSPVLDIKMTTVQETTHDYEMSGRSQFAQVCEADCMDETLERHFKVRTSTIV
ncbi:hypothetical protein DL96DRAFT_1738346 [Flagelloscypha sp. PMI_526]|nr:hypothetical protein DL96DRAFT_1738346 [Flagelloscypha sp. PMI_526]